MAGRAHSRTTISLLALKSGLEWRVGIDEQEDDVLPLILP